MDSIESLAGKIKIPFSHWINMNGQALYSTKPEGLKKVIRDLISIIDRGYVTSQAEAKSKYSVDLSEHKIGSDDFRAGSGNWV